jgi:hypothetical protein
MRVIVVLLAIFLCGIASCLAAANPALGKWDCTGVDEGGVRTTWTLIVKEENGKLSGSLVGVGGEELPLVDPALDGQTFTFKLRINAEELVEVSITIDGNKFDGKFKGKQSGTGTLTGTRQA